MSEKIPGLLFRFVKERWGGGRSVFYSSAPGRVNLIGEHTDYNEGFVLPAAINLRTYSAGVFSGDDRINVTTLNYGEVYQAHLKDLKPPGSARWWTYIAGPAYVLLEEGYDIRGFEIGVYGEVPPGGGLSSSAALEVSVTALLNEMFSLGLEKQKIVEVAKRAENEFSSVPCGIMDQMASVFGERGKAVFIDCRTLEREMVEIPPQWKIVVCDTGVRHELATSQYALRQKECREALHAVRKIYGDVKALRDVSLEALMDARENMSETAFRRAKYVIEENMRVVEAKRAIEAGRRKEVFRLFRESHIGLSREYEVSCMELDILAELAWDLPGVVGARMTGGGFGGNTVNLVMEDYVEEFVGKISRAYEERTKRRCEVRVLEADKGVSAWKER